MMVMNEKQKNALKYMLDGENVFLTGGAGTGKTYVLKEFLKNKNNVVVCAPTGIAALNIGGCTLHKLFNIPIDEIRFDSNREVNEVLSAVKTIVIDEISMCSIKVFDFICQFLFMLSEIPGNLKKQIILAGDFMQLPPISKNRETLFAFQSKYWDKLNFKCVVLEEVYRQADMQFIRKLNQVRVGNINALYWIIKKTESNPIVNNAVIIASKNSYVNKINSEQIKQISGRSKCFNADIGGEWENMPMDKKVNLKIGARVVALVNDKNDRYQNGSLGYVRKIMKNNVEVTFDNGITTIVEPYTWHNWIYDIDDKQQIIKKEIGRFTQIPLRLAYAITIHKSQGQTFNNLVINPDCFAEGQLYVAISRAKSLEGIKFSHIPVEKALIVSPKAKLFYERLKAVQNQDNWGGRRNGAGRKRKYQFKTIPIRIGEHTKSIVEKLQILSLPDLLKVKQYINVLVANSETKK